MDEATAEETAKRISIGALRYYMLRFSRNRVVAFDLDDALAFEGETGPYLQYSAVRASKIFDKLAEWLVAHGLETATFHVLTPYPGTPLHRRLEAEGRMRHGNWDLYDTRHAVFRPAQMDAAELEAGYWRAYQDFYRLGAIVRGAATKPTLGGALRHAAYAIGWKKCEPVWDLLIRARRVGAARPLLERTLEKPLLGRPRHRGGATGQGGGRRRSRALRQAGSGRDRRDPLADGRLEDRHR